MNTKLFKVILSLILLKGIILDDSPCANPNHVFEAGECFCANEAGTNCDSVNSGKVFSTESCACECANRAELDCSVENKVFDEVNCRCDCANRASTTCSSPLIYKDEFCTCLCPGDPIADCQCVGVTYSNTACQCVIPTKSCADVTYNCQTGQFDYPPNPNPDAECASYDETKCEWSVPACPDKQVYKTVYEDGVKTCGCVTPIEDCDTYYLNPDFTAGKSTVKYICKSCKFHSVLNSRATRCYVCQDWKIRVYDSANRLLGNFVYVGDPRKKPIQVVPQIIPDPLPPILVKYDMEKFVIKKYDKICLGCFIIRNRYSVPGDRLFWRHDQTPAFSLSAFEYEPTVEQNWLNFEMFWQIKQDPVQSARKIYRARVNDKDKINVLKWDLTMGPDASVPEDEYNFEFEALC